MSESDELKAFKDGYGYVTGPVECEEEEWDSEMWYRLRWRRYETYFFRCRNKAKKHLGMLVGETPFMVYHLIEAFEQSKENERDLRQSRVYDWAIRTFGQVAVSKMERARRFIEEAVELVQAVGLERDVVHRIVDHVYGKPVGKLSVEVGGAGLTLIALAQALEISAEEAEKIEFERALSISAEEFKERHARKVEAGIAEFSTSEVK